MRVPVCVLVTVLLGVMVSVGVSVFVGVLVDVSLAVPSVVGGSALDVSGVCEAVCPGVCDLEAPMGSELVGVADSVGGTEFDGVPAGELSIETPLESVAVGDSD